MVLEVGRKIYFKYIGAWLGMAWQGGATQGKARFLKNLFRR